MKIYNGWILRIENIDYVVSGSVKLRKTQYYILVNKDRKCSIKRDDLLSGFNKKEITYIGNK